MMAGRLGGVQSIATGNSGQALAELDWLESGLCDCCLAASAFCLAVPACALKSLPCPACMPSASYLPGCHNGCNAVAAGNSGQALAGSAGSFLATARANLALVLAAATARGGGGAEAEAAAASTIGGLQSQLDDHHAAFHAALREVLDFCS